MLSGKNCSVESSDRHWTGTQFAKKTKPKKKMQMSIDMTAPRPAGRRPMAVWHYIFQYGSNFATWAICLGDRHFETDGSRQIRQQNDEEAKNVVFYSSFCDSHVYCKLDPWGGVPSFWSSRSALAERNELRQTGNSAIMSRPGGMRGGGGRGYGEGLRSLQGVCCVSVDCRFGFHTPALVYDKGGGSLRAYRRAGS